MPEAGSAHQELENRLQSAKNCPPLTCPPFLASRTAFGTGCCMLVWLLPMFLAGFGFFLQNFQLRIGTYFYVHKMVSYDTLLQSPNQTAHPEFYTDFPGYPSFGKTAEDVSYGSLQDTISSFLGYEHVNIKFLDILAAFFPFLFTVAACAFDMPRTWTKIMISFFVLAVGKGFFAWVSIVPDSNGWQACKARLGNSSYPVEWYSQERSVMEILFMDPTSRLCADMMWSGHTYFVAIFAFGLHECFQRGLSNYSRKFRYTIESAVFVAAFAQQGVEIYFVLKSHFHYTSDVVMAIFVTYLLYTNALIAVLAKKWTKAAPHTSLDMVNHLARSPYEDKFIDFENVWLSNGLESSGDINLGCCCCVGWGRQHVYSGQQLSQMTGDIVRLSDVAKGASPFDDRLVFDETYRSIVMAAMNCRKEVITEHDSEDEADESEDAEYS